jgi:hypothetical protein
MLLKLRLYETKLFHASKNHVPPARVYFCNWFLRFVHDGEVEIQILFFILVRPGFLDVER